MIPVQYIISARQNLPLLTHAKIAINAGCRWIQLKDTEGSNENLVQTAKSIKELCREHDATFVIENNAELVKAIEADGIHLTDGTSPIEMRQQLGEGFLIGTNASSAEEMVMHKRQSADYICCGPFSEKNNGTENEGYLTTEDFDKMMDDILEQEVTLPICAFGDIAEENVLPIMQTGVRGISIQIPEMEIDENLVKSTLERYLNI